MLQQIPQNVVHGPTSSTDNAIARFDLTTGKIIQNSLVIIDDSGNISTPGTITPSGFTQGSVIFAGTGGILAQDNANLFWDDTNNRLGIVTASPAYTLDVAGSGNLSGQLGVGTTPTSTIGINSSQSFGNNTAGSIGVKSASSISFNTTTANDNFCGINSSPILNLNGTGAVTVTNYFGIQSASTIIGLTASGSTAKIITNWRSFESKPAGNTFIPSSPNNITVTNLSHYYVANNPSWDPQLEITNQYGVYVEPFTKNTFNLTGISVATTDIFTKASHGLSVNMPIVFTALDGAVGISLATTYFVIADTFATGTFKVSATLGGTSVDITTASTGTGITATATQVITNNTGIFVGAGSTSFLPVQMATGPVLSTARAGGIEYTTPQLFFTNDGLQRQELIQSQQSRVSIQYDNTTTTLGNVTGLTATVVAGKIYRFRAILFTSSNVAGGVKAAISGTATATTIIYDGVTQNTTTTSQSRSTALGTAVGAVTAVTAATVKIEGFIVVNAAGTLTVQLAANVATGTTSALVGSNFVIQETI